MNNTIKYNKTSISTTISNSIVFPNHWNLIRAKYLFDLINEKSEFGNEELLSVSEHFGVIKRKNANVNMFMAENYKGYKLCKKGDLVINSLWAWSKGLGFSDEEGIVSTAYGVYRPKLQLVKYLNYKYLHHLLRTKVYVGEFFIRSKGIWISRLILSDSNFLEIPIVLPPLDEQNLIVDFIDKKNQKINHFITQKQNLIALLKEQRQSIINSVVSGQWIIENGKLVKPKKTDEWVTKRLKFIADVKFSNVDKHTHKDEIPVRLCNYTDVYKNDYIVNSMEFMSATCTTQEIEKFKVHKGDIIITKDSETASDIAVPAFVAEELENVVCGYHLAQIRADETQLLSEFLFRKFQSKELNAYLEVEATGVTRVGLSIGDITSILVSFPKSLIMQQAMVDYIKSETQAIDQAIAKTNREIELIKEYKEAMISEAVTGKLILN